MFATGAIVFAALAMGFGTSTWLFLKAEESRAAEAALRERAEIRELCAQAAVRISYGKLEEADRLVANVPVNLVPPSLEAAQVFNKLGEWHIAALRWPQASRCFASLAESMSSVDASDTDNVSRNLLPAVGAACEAGEWDRYERLRKIAVERFGETHHPIVAEQIIKVSLLRPADPAIMARLEPLAVVVADAISGNNASKNNPNLRAWACFSMSLWNHRKGDHEKSIEWACKSLELENLNPARVSSVKLLLAMSHFRLGQTEEARAMFHEAEPVIRAVLNGNIKDWTSGPHGIVWPDWANAHVLLNEAEALIRSGDGR